MEEAEEDSLSPLSLSLLWSGLRDGDEDERRDDEDQFGIILISNKLENEEERWIFAEEESFARRIGQGFWDLAER